MILIAGVSGPVWADDFHYSQDQFARIEGTRLCVALIAPHKGAGQQAALVDDLLRKQGLSFNARRVAQDERLWRYPRYRSQYHLIGYLIQGYKGDCVERYRGRY
ncbi:hypothetical protein A11A3_06823 [Alcanivorax hongdengensis A-11-3]|uniref:Uncharacterized protein n=1 Tax=Alcanivorax hongdengensis A-11-3 TaxID=1177179 RepID=L0WFW0_9GAMM|nr:hypothetical protein [Alcanivorax hongdengensis]EKF74715.1 hypothetical protein A11A3_06823 [Alcanivorax hongdengensis A-11-3]